MIRTSALFARSSGALGLLALRSQLHTTVQTNDSKNELSPWSFERLKEVVPNLTLPSFKKLQDSFETYGANLDRFYDELSGAPGSLYNELVNDFRKDAQLNPEIQWEAHVRLGTDLPIQERAFLRTRRRHIKAAFAQMLNIPEDEIDERDLPIVGVASSGGGYRAMVNAAGSLRAASRMGLLDKTSYIAAISGSCWALGMYYAIAEGDLPTLLSHLKSRIQTDFFDPVTLNLLTTAPTNSYLLSSAVAKSAGKFGDVSLVDAYGVLVSSRLLVPDDLSKLSMNGLKISNQKELIQGGKMPMPLYNMIHHQVPDIEALAKAEEAAQAPPTASKRLFSWNQDKAKQAQIRKTKEDLMGEATWQWWELSPFEVGSAELGAWVPTWSFGRAFDKGKSIEGQPELHLSVLNGVFGSAFCATLQHYYAEIKPLLSTFSAFEYVHAIAEGYTKSMALIHPFPPAPLANIVKGMDASLLPGNPKHITDLDTLAFMDAGAFCNLPYTPLFRRNCDVVIALDASADNQPLWFQRAQEAADQMELHWPQIRFEGLFPSDPTSAQGKVQEAQDQADQMESEPKRAVPTSGGDVNEPALEQVNVWIGKSKDKDDGTSCRVLKGEDMYEAAKRRDGVALVYVPLNHGPHAQEVTETWSTWQFEYTEKQTNRLLDIADDNLSSAETQITDLLRGVYERKKEKRLASASRRV